MAINHPANFPSATNLRKIAVMPFNGQNGPDVAARLEASLQSVNVDGRPYFTVLGGQQVSNEMGKGASRRASGVDMASARQIGRSMGAQGVYGGDVPYFGVDRSTYTEERQECVATKPGGGMFKSCTQWRKYTVNCQKVVAGVEVSPRLIDVSNGSVAYSQTKSAQREASACSDGGGGVPADSELLGSALASVIEQIRRDVAPYTEMTDIALKESPAKLNGKPAERFASGLEYMKANQADRGCRIWSELEQDGIDDTNLSYNLAVCDERKGDLTSALERLRVTDEKLERPDKMFAQAVERIQQRLDGQKEYSRQTKAPGGGPLVGSPERKNAVQSRVREAQNLLRKAGFYTGTTDGVIGPKTQEAVRNYQTENGITPDGQITDTLLRTLRGKAG